MPSVSVASALNVRVHQQENCQKKKEIEEEKKEKKCEHYSMKGMYGMNVSNYRLSCVVQEAKE